VTPTDSFTLDTLPPRATGSIASVEGNDAVARRLREMGLLAGLFLHARAYAVARKELARAREEWSTVDSTRLPGNAWRIPLSSVRRIELRRLQLTASELRIQQAGQREHVFGIFDPWQLGPYAETLRRTYPRIFFEQ